MPGRASIAKRALRLARSVRGLWPPVKGLWRAKRQAGGSRNAELPMRASHEANSAPQGEQWLVLDLPVRFQAQLTRGRSPRRLLPLPLGGRPGGVCTDCQPADQYAAQYADNPHAQQAMRSLQGWYARVGVVISGGWGYSWGWSTDGGLDGLGNRSRAVWTAHSMWKLR